MAGIEGSSLQPVEVICGPIQTNDQSFLDPSAVLYFDGFLLLGFARLEGIITSRCEEPSLKVVRCRGSGAIINVHSPLSFLS